MPERSTASKVRISDIINGMWVDEGGQRIKTPYGEIIARARILGTIVQKFQSEDGNFSTITLDDGTETIRAKVFKGSRMLDKFNIGDVVDLIGKVREYEGETYIAPEIIRKIDDLNMESLRRLEIIEKIVNFKPSESPKERLKKQILAAMEQTGSIEYSELLKLGPEKEVEQAVNELLEDGICYEPEPGKIRKV
ncbi:MAG: OB-fold nucleic acid binding domain-containing protein [Candidatus Micrarchaeia archaeon]